MANLPKLDFDEPEMMQKFGLIYSETSDKFVREGKGLVE
jgi:hypothetical protein